MGSGREVAVLGPRGPLLCLRLPAVRSRGVTRKPFRIVWNGFRATRCRLQPHHLHRRSVPLPPLCDMGLRGCSPSVPRPSCLLFPRAAPWCVSLRPANLAPLRYPLPSSVHRRCHVLNQEELKCPRHSGAEVSSPDRAVPGWLPCLYHPPPLGGRGWKPQCHCCPRCARLVSLAPRPSPPGPLRWSPHQNFGAELLRPSWTEHGGSFRLAEGAVCRPAQGDRRPPSSPRGVSLPPPFTPRPARQAPCAHLGFPGGAVVKNQPAKAGSCKRCKFDP